MADPLWMELRQFAQQIAWPTAMAADPESRVVYEAGLDMVNSYSGDPAVLVKALRQFGQCRSAAYANAGIAAVLMIGSYLRGDTYDQYGLREAELFLRKAQEAVPDRAEINFLNAKLELMRQNDGNARKLLNELHKKYPPSFHVLSVELWYWYNQRNLTFAEKTYERLKACADTQARQLQAANQIAGCYRACHDLDKSLMAYRELLAIDPQDPWSWHNLSLIQIEKGDFLEAEKSNEKALMLMDFPAARQTQRFLQEKNKKGDFWKKAGGLFGSK